MTLTTDIIIYVEKILRQSSEVLKSKIIDRATSKPFPKRTMYSLTDMYIRNHLDPRPNQSSPSWVIIPGLRGVGKSTLLAQHYLQALEQKKRKVTSYENVILIYFSLDDLATIQATLKDGLEAYEKLSGINLATTQEPVLIFLDEVHYDPTWISTLKILHDNNPNIFIFCTGSSAISLQANTDETRRIYVRRLYPASFAEYRMIKTQKYPPKGLKREIKDALWGGEEVLNTFSRLKYLEKKVDNSWKQIGGTKDEINYYLIRGSIPFASALKDEQEALDQIMQTIRSIIRIDLPKQATHTFDQETLDIVLKLLWRLANSSDTSLRNMADEFGKDAKTIGNVLQALEQAELLIKMLPYSESRRHRAGMKPTTRPNKYLFMSPTMRAAILNGIGGRNLLDEKRGYLLEDAFALYFYKEIIQSGSGSVMYIKDDKEASADFMVERAGSFIPVEIGSGVNKSCKQVINVIKNTKNCPYGFIFCDCEEVELIEGKIIRVPLRFPLLS